MTIVNCTPHAIHLRKVDGSAVVIPASGMIARAPTRDAVIDVVDGFPVHAMEITGDRLDGLPDPADDTIYVTSLLAAQVAVKLGRTDVYATGPAIRDEQGRVVGADGLSRP